MSLETTLEIAQASARELLIEQFDEKRGIPVRAASHPDLWPGDRWPEAYLAAGEPEYAAAAGTAIAKSLRADGAFPHLMQGSHKRAGIESRWIDRQVYRLQGNGAERLSNGNWVTKSFAPPTQALSALALHHAGIALPESLQPASLSNSLEALYRGRAHQGMIAAHNIDELTDRDGKLAEEIKINGYAIDPAINALATQNYRALVELAAEMGETINEDLKYDSATTHEYLVRILRKKRGNMSREDTLAAARLKRIYSEGSLADVYTQPNPSDPHPEKSHLSMAECLEIARLTPQFEATQIYLERVIPKIAALGSAGLTRFEGVSPGKHAIANRSGRKQIWLPTAAELMQLDLS